MQRTPKNVVLAFIDFSKTFDSLRHYFLLKAFLNQAIPKIYVKIIGKIYENLQARILTDKEGEYFSIKRGVKQEDPMSPILFNRALEEIFKNLDWEDKRISIEGEKLNNLRYAGDVVLISENIEDLKIMISDLIHEGRKSFVVESYGYRRVFRFIS